MSAAVDVVFCPGDGTRQTIRVARIAGGFARREDGTCAFCAGDPCAESSGPETLIGAYFARNNYADTCPCCEGRAS